MRNKHNKHTLSKGLFTVVLLPILLAVVLLGCPVAAPEAKKKGGDDGGDDPIVYVEKISFPFISPHSIVVDILLTDDIDGETTLVITETATKPAPPNDAGFAPTIAENAENTIIISVRDNHARTNLSIIEK